MIIALILAAIAVRAAPLNAQAPKLLGAATDPYAGDSISLPCAVVGHLVEFNDLGYCELTALAGSTVTAELAAPSSEDAFLRTQFLYNDPHIAGGLPITVVVRHGNRSSIVLRGIPKRPYTVWVTWLPTPVSQLCAEAQAVERAKKTACGSLPRLPRLHHVAPPPTDRNVGYYVVLPFAFLGQGLASFVDRGPATLRSVGNALSLLALAGVTGVALLLFTRWRRRRHQSIDIESAGALTADQQANTTVDPVHTAVSRALISLDVDADAREAIVSCWGVLEETAAQREVARGASETSTELTDRLRATCEVDESTLMQLHALFRTARFSSQPISSKMRATARQALIELRSSLEESRLS